MAYSSIIFNQIRVNEMGTNSGVFTGNNKVAFGRPFGKQQAGIELQNGRAIRNRTYICDNDVVDIVVITPFTGKKRNNVKKNRTAPRLARNVRSKRRTSIMQK